MLRNHPLFQTLRELKGNPRITVLTEVMFGIPYNLFAPFFSVYMLALGLNRPADREHCQPGACTSDLHSPAQRRDRGQVWAPLNAAHLRMLCWSVPCLIWAFAQDVRFFVAAAVMNSLWRVSHTAWTCLMVEDAEERHLVHIWTWIMIFAVCSAFFTPLGGWVVARLA